jgi:hypothetical protein
MENQRAWISIPEALPKDGSVIWEQGENGLQALATYSAAGVGESAYGFIGRVAFSLDFVPMKPVRWRYDN